MATVTRGMQPEKKPDKKTRPPWGVNPQQPRQGSRTRMSIPNAKQDFRERMFERDRYVSDIDQQEYRMFKSIKCGAWDVSIQADRGKHCTPRMTLDSPFYYSEFEMKIWRPEVGADGGCHMDDAEQKELFAAFPWAELICFGIISYVPVATVQQIVDDLETLAYTPKGAVSQ